MIVRFVPLLLLVLVHSLVPALQAATHITNLRPPVFAADALAISGDTLVIGAKIAFDRTAAEVYVRTEGEWRHRARLRPSDDQQTFSSASVAVDGDTVILGDWGADDGDGAAYVFKRTGNTWSQQAKLLVEVDNDLEPVGFGFSIALDGDLAVINTLSRDDLAYVFRREGDHWRLEDMLQVDDGLPNLLNLTGHVAIDGDAAVLGVASDSAAYVFRRGVAGWVRDAKLTADDGEVGDLFGAAVDVSGDRVLVGAHRDDNPGNRSQGSEYSGRATGAVYVFSREPGGWRQEVKLLARDRAAGDLFGRSVALDGGTALIGAIGTRDEGFGGGSAYVYRRIGNAWVFQAKLVSSDQEEFSFGWNVVLDDGNAAVLPPIAGDVWSTYVFSLQPRPFLRCLEDLGGDGLPGLAMIMPGGATAVRRADGTLLNAFSFDGFADIVDVAVLPETGSNQAPELIDLDRRLAKAQVRDALTGAALTTIPLAPYLTPLELDVVLAQSSGIPLIAALGWRPVTARLTDALSGGARGDVVFVSPIFNPRGLLVYPDMDGNGVPEGALLAENKRPLNSDKVEIRDLFSGTLTGQIWFGNDCDDRGVFFCRTLASHQQVLVADVDGNGFPELAVLRIGGRPPQDFGVEAVLRDGKTGRPLGRIPLDADYPPERLLSMADMNGNGTDELLAFARRAGFGNQRVMIKDSGTGQLLNSMFFDKTAPMQDLTICSDMNGNGAAEVALLGRRLRDDGLKAIVKDGASGERLAVVRF